MFFDAARVVMHPNLSLAGGAIRGWDSNSTFYWMMISALAMHYKFDTSVPWEELPEKIQKLILHGFPDGPPPSGLRFCINAVSLRKAKGR
jgi:excinuclease ABC subunit A